MNKFESKEVEIRPGIIGVLRPGEQITLHSEKSSLDSYTITTYRKLNALIEACDKCFVEGVKDPLVEDALMDCRNNAEISDNRSLVKFLYVLMRDYLPTGDIEKILADHVLKSSGKNAVFSNPYLALYAKEIADTIEGKE